MIKAGSVPGQMDTVTTEIENIYVKIAWDYPVDNSDSVTEYEILIRQSDQATFSSELIHCDGRSSAVVQKQYCHVPMLILRTAPFSLQFQDYIVVKIRAKNSIGWGLYSDLNNLDT